MDGAGNSVFGEEAFEGTGTLREREVRPRITALICGGILPAGERPSGLAKATGPQFGANHPNLCGCYCAGHSKADQGAVGVDVKNGEEHADSRKQPDAPPG